MKEASVLVSDRVEQKKPIKSDKEVEWSLLFKELAESLKVGNLGRWKTGGRLLCGIRLVIESETAPKGYKGWGQVDKGYYVEMVKNASTGKVEVFLTNFDVDNLHDKKSCTLIDSQDFKDSMLQLRERAALKWIKEHLSKSIDNSGILDKAINSAHINLMHKYKGRELDKGLVLGSHDDVQLITNKDGFFLLTPWTPTGFKLKTQNFLDVWDSAFEPLVSVYQHIEKVGVKDGLGKKILSRIKEHDPLVFEEAVSMTQARLLRKSLCMDGVKKEVKNVESEDLTSVGIECSGQIKKHRL